MTNVKGRRPKPAAQAAPVVVAGKSLPRIVSVTISNNKQDIVAEALTSAMSRVDRCILVDTGITDNTIEVARRVVGDKLLVCKFGRDPKLWFNYAAARNAALNFAVEDKADWAVIVDTDERMHWNELDLRQALVDAPVDVYWMKSADGVYMKEKVVRLAAVGPQGTRYWGDTHEVLIAKSKALLERATFDELPRTPEHMREKLSRDAPVLMDMVSRDEFKNDGRWWFYLGDTHHGLGNLDAAARAFGRSVDLRPGPSEDGAYAAYRQAECLCIQNRFVEAVEACARGLTRHSGVSELPWLAAYASAQAGNRDQAVYWARMAIPNGSYRGRMPARDGFTHPPALFENPFDVLRHLAPTVEERTEAEAEFQVARRVRMGARSDEDVDRLSIARPCRFKDEFRKMLRPPCLRQLVARSMELWNIALSTKTLNEAGIPGYHPLNPSLCLHKGKLHIVVRTVNYHIDNGRYVTPDDDAGRVKTVNFLGTISLTENGPKIVDLRHMRDLDDGPRQPTMVLGYEDVRLFTVKGRLWASATVRDRDRDRCQIALLEIGSKGDIVKAHIQTVNTEWTEKNWMPILCDDVKWVYGLDPTQPRRKDGHMEALPTKFALDHLRGGSQVVPFEDGWLCVAHETITQENWGCRRIYLHRFVRLDKKFSVTSVSRAFVFEQDAEGKPHYGIEFCSTLAWDPKRKGKLVLGYGVEDVEAKLLVVDAEDVKGLRWWQPEDVK